MVILLRRALMVGVCLLFLAGVAGIVVNTLLPTEDASAPISRQSIRNITKNPSSLLPAPVLPLSQPAGGAPAATNGQSTVAQSFKQLLDGTMRYEVPTVMTIDEPQVVTLRISGAPDDKSLAANFPGTSERVKFADSIRASLYGGDDFAVTPRQADNAQLIPPTGFSDWQWDVKPLHSGHARLLTLRLDTYLHVNGRDVFFSTSKERTITVNVNSARAVTDFAKDHLEWLWGLLVLPAGEFLRRRRKPTASLTPKGSIPSITETVDLADRLEKQLTEY